MHKGLSIIIPTYNEAETVTKIARRIVDVMNKTDIAYEIIFVDDHSTDQTKRKIQSLSQAYPIQLLVKKGPRGKGFSIAQGFLSTTYSHIAMIDADLQYPPEILPALYEKATETGFSVANRATYDSTWLRRLASRANAYIFGKLLLNLHTDVQSGLKVFHRDVFINLQPHLVSAWGIDIPLIHTAYNLGFTPSHVDIDFRPRDTGVSKVNFLRTSWEIARGAISIGLSNAKVMQLSDGFAYKRKRFTTHTTLSHHNSALVTFVPWQKVFIWAIVLLLVIGAFTNPLTTAIIFMGIVSFIYFLDVLFNLFVVLKSLHFPPELTASDDDIHALKESQLPIYTILCPLYREARVLPQFIEAIERMDWPKQKLEVLLLLESDDTHTIDAARAMKLPSYVRTVIVPDSQPKTKPKACNYGLKIAKGEYVVVFDAEDKPEPTQLKKAYIAFTQSSEKIVCLQAKLNYYNPHHNILTRLFTAEYSLWFDVILPGLQSINTTIPLGGTSNHFRTQKLRELQGWDPFNVTEDCDLGARLFANGYKTAIIDSTTLEEANSDIKNWFRQRSRWIKGYIQTYLVQMRNPVEFVKNHGWHSVLFQLIVGCRISFMFINPLLWIITISYFALYALVAPTIESLFPTVIFYMAVSSLVFGNFIYLYNYMIGSARRAHWELIKYTFFIPFYWLMMSWGAVIALYQLVFKPHYWEKTIHGLHLIHAEAQREKEILRLKAAPIRARKLARIADLVHSKTLLGSGLLVFASLFANIMNFLYNAYLGRQADLEQFGIISLIGSFLYIAQVPFGALAKTMTHKSAYLLGKYKTPAKDLWRNTRKMTIIISSITAIGWLILSPVLNAFFHTNSLLPYLLFTPVWIIGAMLAVDSGFLSGTLKFSSIAVISITEAAVKFFSSFLFVQFDATQYVYASVPISMTMSFFVAWILARRVKRNNAIPYLSAPLLRLPRKFFATSILLSLSSITYLSLDLLLAKHYLSAEEAGAYSFLTLAGKMVFFLSSLFGQFTIPLLSQELGEGASHRVFGKLLRIIIGTNVFGVILFGVFGFITVPLLWGQNAAFIVPYLPVYTLAMACYSLSGLIITHNQIRGRFIFPIAGFAFSLIQVFGMMMYHQSIEQLVFVMAVAAFVSLTGIILMDQLYEKLITFYKNSLDFLGLFGSTPIQVNVPNGHLRILIFNWRDLTHRWSGGAEVYVHELAKRWALKGHKITIFCGNDQHSKRYETKDGVHIIRRGGFYMVYLWAFLYYMRFFRGKFDVIIDSENGLPFFTPLYAKEKVFLLIHHVHQEVFRKSLIPPFSWIAQFLELRIMPLVYKNTEIMTVSPSSKTEILENNLTTKDPFIIYNGVDLTTYTPGPKSKHPMVLYLGRLTSAKSIHVLIEAIQKIRTWIPNIEVVIAGDGPEKDRLIKLAREKKLTDVITFLGKVTEETKIKLLQQAWVFVNPSLMEGWGITTIEANACGTPVVASNVAGLRDAVHNPHSGLLVPYGNVDEFSHAILQLVKETSMRNRMNKESVIWAKKFDWNKSANDALTIISK